MTPGRIFDRLDICFLLFLVGRRFRESAARRRLAAVAAERIGTAFEFSDPLRQRHVQFPQLPILLGHGGFLGRMRRNEFGLLGLDLG